MRNNVLRLFGNKHACRLGQLLPAVHHHAYYRHQHRHTCCCCAALRLPVCQVAHMVCGLLLLALVCAILL